jgi:secreted trypsin-like serine protease
MIRMIIATSALVLGLFAVPAAAPALVGGVESTDPQGLRRSVIMVRMGGSFCSAAPISPTVLITAAHCFAAPGAWMASSLSAAFLPRQVKVRSVVMHPDYSPVARFGRDPMADLALVLLDAPLPADVRTVRIDGKEATPGEELIVSGFGRNEGASAEGALVLRELKLKVLERSTGIQEIVLTETGQKMAKPGKGTCRGDSGGPALRMGARGPEIVGVSSWSRGPSSENICGVQSVFVDVAAKKPWIDKQLTTWGERLP